MSQQTAAWYEALGLAEGASPAEVKKAYFKLVRKYTPEKNPEEFQKIRQAYEALKDGAPADEDEMPFEAPDDPVVIYSSKRGLRLMNDGRYAEAAKIFIEALDYAPDDPWLLYQLTSAQLRAGNSQKAAKTAEALIRVQPNFKDGYMLLANALYDRGWHKKALPAFQKAYDMGVRGLNFLTDFASDALDNGQKALAVRIFWEILETKKWDENTIYAGFFAFNQLAAVEDFSAEANRNRYVERYEAFIRSNRRLVDDAEIALAPFSVISKDQPKALRNNAFYNQLDALASRIDDFSDGAWHRLMLIARQFLLQAALDEDPRKLSGEWVMFPCLPSEIAYKDEEPLYRFSVLDAQLCALKNRDALLNELPIIEKDYPYLYGWYSEFFDAFRNGDVNSLFKKLKWEFDKLAKKYTGDRYSEKYPDMTTPKAITSEEDASQPYVRTKAKVGPNDPCPCGSGKKFKKCCMGNGQYD